MIFLFIYFSRNGLKKKKELNLKVKYIFFIVVEPNEIYVFKNKKKPCTFIKFGCVLLK